SGSARRLLQRSRHLGRRTSAGLRSARGDARARNGDARGGAHGEVPRPAPRASLHPATLDVLLAGRLPRQGRARRVALGADAQPDDRHTRRLPRIAHGPRLRLACRRRLSRLRDDAARRRLLRLPKTRRHFRRRDLKTMEPVVVRVENVGKRYRIGALHPGFLTFREVLGDALAAPLRRLRGANGSRYETLWALSDVNLEVRRGEMLGVIGHNGAGKSTLLKLLSRITRPTTGEVEIYGRVGSLLEVGTGFHPELTGRENIFLNGAILGMRRAEIERKFDEIVAFSEVEQFIETPVKWYSSGMYVRLAFSVAAHLEPEILIMDEVLAVGDAAFQQKCLDKLHEIRQQGRTIFFVSHSMPAVTRLCKRALLMRQGEIVADGDARAVVNTYLSSSWNVGAERRWTDTDAPGDAVVRLRRVRVCDD